MHILILKLRCSTPARLLARLGCEDAGSVLIETVLAYMLMMTMILGIMECCMMAYTYSVYADAVRQGVRYGTFHGASSSNCSGPSIGCADPAGANVASAVTTATTGLITPVSGAIIAVTYPDGSSAAPSRVSVAATYTYISVFHIPAITQVFKVSSTGRILY